MEFPRKGFYFRTIKILIALEKMKSWPVLEQILIEHCAIHLGVMPYLQEIGDLVDGTLGKQHMIEMLARA
jgi:hypothetical protein